MAAKNSRAYDDRAKQQEHAQHIGVQDRIAQQNPDEAEGGAGCTEGEVKPFPGAAREAQQDQQHAGDDHVDCEQDDSAVLVSSCIPTAWSCQGDISTLPKGDIIILPPQPMV